MTQATGAISRSKGEVKVLVELRVDRWRRVDHEECVAIGGRFYDCLGGNIGASAWPVLDDEWLPEAFREPLPDQSRDNFRSTARGIAND